MRTPFHPRLLAFVGTALAFSAIAPSAAKQTPVSLKSVGERIVAPLDMASLNRLGMVALTGDPGKLGGFLPAFDRRLDTSYEAKEPGPAHIDVAFARPQMLRSIRLQFGDAPCEWSVAVAESGADLERLAEKPQYLVQPGTHSATLGWEEASLAGKDLASIVPVKALRLTLIPRTKGGTVTLRDCFLNGEQTLEAVGINVKSAAVPLGENTPLEVVGFFSGGETRPVTSRAFQWTVIPSTSARLVGGNRLLGLRRGPMELRLQFDKLSAPPLPLEVVDGN